MESDKFSKTFTSICPRKLDKLPKEPCSLGHPTFFEDERIDMEPHCDWWIASKESNFCFWKYLQLHSEEDGSMKELLQSELAKLFGCSSTKIHFMLKEALTEFEKIVNENTILTDLDYEDDTIVELSIDDIEELNEMDEE